MAKISEYSECIKYINNNWKILTAKTEKDNGLIIGLPNPYICPSRDEFDQKMYYWDSYFIILGLLCSGKVTLAKGMAENLFYLFNRFEFIPQSNRFYHLGKSNPPFLTSIIEEIFSVIQDKSLLRNALKIAIGEYEKVWTFGYRLTDNGLSRYWEPTHTHEQAEDESGWDKTSRFLNKCLDINPIDLNCLLYKYEKDISQFYTILNNKKKSVHWKSKASYRKGLINKHMWDENKGFFFDYNHIKKRKNSAWSLAGFFPLFTELANKKQALLLRNNIKHLEYRGGLVTTKKKYLKDDQRQWDYPIGWAPLHWIVIKGLLNYGFKEDAERIAVKWLNTCTKVFNKTGKFWEKYNVVTPGIGRGGRYPTQSGFGWTNGVLVKLLDVMEQIIL